MIASATNPVETVPDYLAEFDDEVTINNALPFCQIQNPSNMSLAKIQQLKEPWGIFIASDQAEIAQFTPTADFSQTTLIFDQDSADPREVEGYLTQHTRFVVIQRSPIEVQDSEGRYLGLAFEKGRNGQKTELGEKAWADSDNYRVRTLYLIVFLDKDNQPLHKIPFQLSMGKGTGGAFSQEAAIFAEEIEKVFFKLRKQPQRSLSDKAHALTVLDIEWTVTKNEGKAPFVTPVKRLAPAIKEVGVQREYERRGRKVVLEGVAIESLLIPKSSNTGQFILRIWQEYSDFATKYQDDEARGQKATDNRYQPSEVQESVETLDFTYIINRTNDLMQQLGWTAEDGRQYIIDEYGKKSRQLLDDQQLMEFLGYLEDLALGNKAEAVADDDLEF